jgi:hypothetical protein
MKHQITSYIPYFWIFLIKSRKKEPMMFMMKDNFSEILDYTQFKIGEDTLMI